MADEPASRKKTWLWGGPAGSLFPRTGQRCTAGPGAQHMTQAEEDIGEIVLYNLIE